VSKEPPTAAVGSGILVAIAVQLLPAIAGITCVVYTKVAVDRGPLWFLAGLLFIPAALGLFTSVVTLVLAVALRKIKRGYLIAACLMISALGIGWWCSLYGIRDPYSL
jgi:hypothetical protein